MGEGSSGVVACGWQILSHMPCPANSDWPCMQVTVLDTLAWCFSSPHGVPRGLEPQAPSGFPKSYCMNGLQDMVGISVHRRGAVGAALGLLPALSYRCQLLSSLLLQLSWQWVHLHQHPQRHPPTHLSDVSIEIYLIDMYLYISTKFLPRLQSICFVLLCVKGKVFQQKHTKCVFFFLIFFIDSMHSTLVFFLLSSFFFMREERQQQS